MENHPSRNRKWNSCCACYEFYCMAYMHVAPSTTLGCPCRGPDQLEDGGKKNALGAGNGY
jgi:hypothetical protein